MTTEIAGSVLTVDDLITTDLQLLSGEEPLTPPTGAGLPLEIPTFYSFHPAYLDTRRNPSAARAVGDHLSVLAAHLKGTDPLHRHIQAGGIQRHLPPSPTHGDYLSLDIETYGKIEGLPEQRAFQPHKMEHLDGCPRSRMIATVALSWINPTDGGLISSASPWNPETERWLHAHLQRAAERDTLLLGKNTLFDLMVLRYCAPLVRSALRPFRTRIWDLALTSYFDDPERPEKGLKELSVLFGRGAYAELPDQRHPSPESPALLAYNIEDTEKTLDLELFLSDRVAKLSPGTPRLRAYCREFYSDVLWSLLLMSEAGVALDIKGLADLECRLMRGMASVYYMAEDRENLLLSGKGSPVSQREHVKTLWAHTGLDAPLTKTGLISLKAEDCDDLRERLSRLPDYVPSLDRGLRFLQAFKKLQKLYSTYVRSILHGGAKTSQYLSQAVHGISHPTWYPCPSRSKDEADDEGGTRFGRPVCREPAHATFPSLIKKYEVSRWGPSGFYLSFDYKQLELKVAAILSADPLFMEEVMPGSDQHAATARRYAALGITTESDLTNRFKYWRGLAKRQNFRRVYGGGPGKAVQTFWTWGRVRVPYDLCQREDDDFFERHPVFAQWQKNLLAEAIHTHRLELPLTGNVRWFEGDSTTVEETYYSEIVNFPVQGTAALIALSAGIDMQKAFIRFGLQSMLVMNRYDALYFDGPIHERPIVSSLAAKILPNPSYYQKLCAHLGRTIPLELD